MILLKPFVMVDFFKAMCVKELQNNKQLKQNKTGTPGETHCRQFGILVWFDYFHWHLLLHAPHISAKA